MRERPRAAIYARISKDRTGAGLGVADQERLCRTVADRLGLTVTQVFTDNDVSAAKGNSRSRPRPGYNALLEAISSGKVDAVLAWHTDRLHRNLAELNHYITVCGEGRNGVPTYTVMGGDLDLSTASGRTVARILGSVAQGEVEHMIERMKASHERRRRQGIVRSGGRGGRAFAYATDGVTIVEKEAEAVREAAARVLAGESVGSICRDLTERGHRTPAGNEITYGTLRKMLARPRYAGLMPDGQAKAAWEPVLDRATWEAVRAALDAKAAGFSYATNARRWLLSGIAVCGVCGSGLQIRAEHRRTHLTGYGCVRPGCRKVQRSAAALDEYVSTMTVDRLNAPGSPAPRAPAAPALAARWAALARQRAEADAALRDPARGAYAGALLARLEAIDAQMDDLRELSAASAGQRLAAAHAGISREDFDALPLASRRALVAALWRIEVLPAGRRGPGFDPVKVVIEPR